MDLIFHGPLGMELSLDRSAGVPRVKDAEHDSPALLVVGRALTAIEGVPVGEIRDKKSWLAVVAKLQAPERPLSLSFEAPPEEDPVAEERARAELQPVAERAECALSTEHIEERFLARERARMAKDYRTADAIEKELTLAGVNHNKARWWIPGTSREGPMPRARDTGALCRYYSAGRPCPHGDRCQFLHADDSRPGERVPVASSARRSRSRSRSRSPRRRRETSPPRRNRHDTAPPGLGQRPTRRHLVSAAESARVPQPPVESEPAARGPTGDYIREPPDDDAIFDMVLAQEREKARIARDYATADRMRAEMAAAGLTVVYRDATGRPDKSRGAVTWYTNDGRTGPPSLSTVEIESRLRAWIRARDVDQNHSRTRDLLAECAARGIGRSENWNSAGGQWFTAHGQRGPMPSLEGDTPAAPPVPSAVSESGGICTSLGDRHEASWREATVGRCPPDDVIRQRLVERALAKLQRDFRRADAIQADLARAGVHTSDVKGQVNGLVRWTATDGRSGPKPPSDSEIYDMVLACERAKHTGASSQMIRPMVAEMTISGVVTENRDRSGRAHPHGALRWCCVDGRTGPPKMSEIDIEARVREWTWARKDRNFRRSDELEVELAARGVRVDRELGWFTAGPGGLSGPIPSLEGAAPAAPPVLREAPVGRCPPDDVISQRLVERAIARLKRDFRRADAIEAELAREGVQTFAVAAPVKGLVRWTTTDGRSGPKPPSDSEIYDMMLAYEQGKHDRFSSKSFHQKLAEMTVSGVVSDNFDRAGRLYKQGALRWFTIDGRTGPPKMSERDIEARVREWARAQADRNFCRSDDLRDDLAARGVRVDRHDWFTAGPGGLSGPTSLDRNRSRSRSRSRSPPRRSRYDTAPPAANHYGPAPPQAPPPANRYGPAPGKRPRPPSPPGLEQRPTRRHLVAAAPAPSEASSSDGF